MKFRLFVRMALVLSIFLIWGCSDHSVQPSLEKNTMPNEAAQAYHRFSFEECQPVSKQGMTKKVDNFAIIFDPSASMTETYEASGDCIKCHDGFRNSEYAEQHAVKNGGREFVRKSKTDEPLRCNECHQDYLFSKFKFAKQLVNCFNRSIPDLEMTGILRTFGYPVYTRLGHGPEAYQKDAYARSLKKIFEADGVSPLALTLSAVSKDLFKLKGKKAVIIISDGKDMNQEEVLAAEELKERYGEDICIYTIHIGNDTDGKILMGKIAAAGLCGESVSGDTLLERTEMGNLVREIFLQKDSDGDGVPDIKDDCPDTKPGVSVDENGCWKLVVLDNVLFDFDKYNLKPEGVRILNQVVDLLNKHEFLDLHISGHTDNYGSMDYNIRLSRQRVDSGMNYLLKQGISPNRVTTSWHSYSMPVATNDTPEGRALNRRLEFKFKKRQNQ